MKGILVSCLGPLANKRARIYKGIAIPQRSAAIPIRDITQPCCYIGCPRVNPQMASENLRGGKALAAQSSLAKSGVQAIPCVEPFSQVEALIKSNVPDSRVRMSRNAFDPMGTCRTSVFLLLTFLKLPWWLDAIFKSKIIERIQPPKKNIYRKAQSLQ